LATRWLEGGLRVALVEPEDSSFSLLHSLGEGGLGFARDFCFLLSLEWYLNVHKVDAEPGGEGAIHTVVTPSIHA
jgi:hypothetical protein